MEAGHGQVPEEAEGPDPDEHPPRGHDRDQEGLPQPWQAQWLGGSNTGTQVSSYYKYKYIYILYIFIYNIIVLLGWNLAIARYQPRPCGQQGGLCPHLLLKKYVA